MLIPDKQKVSEEKVIIGKAAEVRLALGRASVEAQKMEEFVLTLELQVTTALEDAVVARQQADEAERMAEEVSLIGLCL